MHFVFVCTVFFVEDVAAQRKAAQDGHVQVLEQSEVNYLA